MERLSLLPRLPDVVKDKKPVQPDIWWHEVFSKNDLPKLQEVISLGLSLFTGPIVEGTCSQVQNIVTDKHNCLQDRSVSAILSVRSAVEADGRSLEDMFPVGPDASINSRRFEQSDTRIKPTMTEKETRKTPNLRTYIWHVPQKERH